MNAVTCLQWVKRGAAKANPDHVKLTGEEMADLVKDMKKTALEEESEDDSEDSELPRKRKLNKKSTKTNEMDTKESEALNADEEESDNEGEDVNRLNLADVTYYANPSDDPFLLKEPDSDDDLEILPADNLIALGKVNKDDCNLEVYVYNESDGNCWCHHDYILPTIPLCIEWLNFDPSSEQLGNFVAVGSMSPDIEIWDLDVLESLEPAFILSGSKPSKKKKKKSKITGHVDAVLDLSWNKNQRQALASASADFTLGLWDLEEMEVVTKFEHKEKVQSIQWHKTDAFAILSGCADGTIKLFDCRNLTPDVIEWQIKGEVENVQWDTKNENCFLASNDEGNIFYFDKRNTSKHVFSFRAHNESVTGMMLNDKIEGCLVTCSSDKSIKLWDINDHKDVKCVMRKDINIGQLFCVSLCPDANLLYAVGGERELKVLNVKKNTAVLKHFGLDVPNKLADEDIDIPVEGGMDGDNTEEQELYLPAATEVVKKKKTHRGKRKSKNLTTNAEESNIDKSKNDVKKQATVTESIDDSVEMETVAKKKNKKKKKNKLKNKEND